MIQQRLASFAKTSTARLAVSYLAIIMTMSIGFSIVFYQTSSKELERRVLPPGAVIQIAPQARFDFAGYIADRIAEGKRRLLVNLALLNMLTLAGGGYVSYVLARKTLEPIEKALRAQSRFASDASHELRTPLATIQAENEVVLRKKDLTLDRAKQTLESNVEEIKRLRDITNGLLKLAREEKIELLPLHIADPVQDALDAQQKQAENKHITITQDIHDQSMRGDKQSLQQLFSILLDNAIKYSPENSTISVGTNIRDHHIHIRFADHGQGISEDELPHIFERFYRADAARSSHTGSGFGLGLSIAEKIAIQHNGWIDVESKLGKGSTFTVVLPLTKT